MALLKHWDSLHACVHRLAPNASSFWHAPLVLLQDSLHYRLKSVKTMILYTHAECYVHSADYRIACKAAVMLLFILIAIHGKVFPQVISNGVHNKSTWKLAL